MVAAVIDHGCVLPLARLEADKVQLRVRKVHILQDGLVIGVAPSRVCVFQIRSRWQVAVVGTGSLIVGPDAAQMIWGWHSVAAVALRLEHGGENLLELGEGPVPPYWRLLRLGGGRCAVTSRLVEMVTAWLVIIVGAKTAHRVKGEKEIGLVGQLLLDKNRQALIYAYPAIGVIKVEKLAEKFLVFRRPEKGLTDQPSSQLPHIRRLRLIKQCVNFEQALLPN